MTSAIIEYCDAAAADIANSELKLAESPRCSVAVSFSMLRESVLALLESAVTLVESVVTLEVESGGVSLSSSTFSYGGGVTFLYMLLTRCFLFKLQQKYVNTLMINGI